MFKFKGDGVELFIFLGRGLLDWWVVGGVGICGNEVEVKGRQ